MRWVRSIVLGRLLVLSTLASNAAAGDQWLNNGVETEVTFEDYPAAVQTLAEKETQLYSKDTSNFPVLRVFTSFPETVHDRMVWPMMKVLTRRFHPLLGPHAVFYVEDGVSFGCRTLKDGIEQPLYSIYCRAHCLRSGRYCLSYDVPTEENPHNHNGRVVLEEIFRRSCLIHHYHTKEMKIYNYMEQFHRNHCLRKDDVTSCSLSAMEKVGAHPTSLAQCLHLDEVDEDAPSHLLDVHLSHLKGKKLEDLPQMEVDGKAFVINQDWPFNSHSLLSHFCDAFDDPPLACQYCLPCEDVRTCLWKLVCDGRPLFVDDSPPLFNHSETSETSATFVSRDNASSTTKTTSVFDSLDHHSSNNDGLFILVISVVVLTAICPATFLTYRHLRTKQMMNEILATLPTEEAEAKASVSREVPLCRLGDSCRRRLERRDRPESQRDTKMHDTFKDEEDTESQEDDLVVEDLLDDKSEEIESGQREMHRAHSNLNEKMDQSGPKHGGLFQVNSGDGGSHVVRADTQQPLEAKQRAASEELPLVYRLDREDANWAELMC